MTSIPVAAVVTGSRVPSTALEHAVHQTLLFVQPRLILVGDCPTGADLYAWEWARIRGVPAHIFRAQWNLHGKAAGPLRNQAMIDHALRFDDLVRVYAFPHREKSRGTWDCVRRARAAGLETRIIRL